MSVLLGPEQANRFDKVHLITYKKAHLSSYSSDEAVIVSIMDRNHYPLLVDIRYIDQSRANDARQYIALKLGLQYCQYYSREVVCFGQSHTCVDHMNSDLRIANKTLEIAKNDILVIAKNFVSVSYDEIGMDHLFIQQTEYYLSEIESFGSLHGQSTRANLLLYVEKDTIPDWALSPYNAKYSTEV